VYAAEIAAFEGTSYEALTRFEALVPLGERIVGTAWWPHGQIRVVPARSDAGSSSTRQRRGDAPVIRLATPQMTPATLVHEFAHVLAGVMHGHDAVFRRAHVDVAAAAFNDEPAAWLLEGYTQMGLELAARAWPTPTFESSDRGPVAL
jgi:hypothetical protein